MVYPQTSFASTVIDDDSLIGMRRKAAGANTLMYQLDVLKKTGRYDAFKLKWHPVYDEPYLVWPIPNHLFWDSDVAKWIEGACYFLKQQKLPNVEEAVKELVDMIRSAQQPDGYLNIHYTVVQPGKRFTNLRDMHELYNAGHLIEAALAHNDLYHNDLMLAPILRYVDLLAETFGPESDKLHGYPGHPEIELALLRLYDRTNDPKHLKLARYFLLERGNPKGVDGQNYFMWEMQRRGEDPDRRPAFYPDPPSECLWYHQAHTPIIDQPTIEGHSVRAMYLLTAVADLCRIETSPETGHLRTALYRLWDNMTSRKMYITGGIGAMKQWEGFGSDFFLPQGTDDGGCYSETCAAIAIMMLAHRILEFDVDGRFADIMELCLYNAILTAMSYDGKAFTYVNQLASSDSDLSERKDWFVVACCPPNMLRLLGSIGGYIWTQHFDEAAGKCEIAVNLYISSTLETTVGGAKVRVRQQGDWPSAGVNTFSVESTSENVGLNLRIPGWAEKHTIEPACPTAVLKNGYLKLPADWVASNRVFKLTIPLESRWIMPDPRTGQNTLALTRGPVVYCVEDVDNAWVDDHFKSVSIDRTAPIVESNVTDEQTGDQYVALDLKGGARRVDFNALQANPSIGVKDVASAVQDSKPIDVLRLVPYYFRANRGGKGHMRVGLKDWRI